MADFFGMGGLGKWRKHLRINRRLTVIPITYNMISPTYLALGALMDEPPTTI